MPEKRVPEAVDELCFRVTFKRSDIGKPYSIKNEYGLKLRQKTGDDSVVEVSEVRARSPAHYSGITVGATIVSVDGTPVSSITVIRQHLLSKWANSLDVDVIFKSATPRAKKGKVHLTKRKTPTEEFELVLKKTKKEEQMRFLSEEQKARKKEEDRQRKREERLLETPAKKRARVEQVADKRRAALETETAEERLARLEQDAEGHRRALETETAEERLARLERDSERRRRALETETAEERLARLEQDSERRRRALETETAEERLARLEQDAEGHRRALETETAEERLARLERDSERRRRALETETAEERLARLEQDSERRRRALETETAEERLARLEQDAEGHRRALETETAEERLARLERDAEGHRRARTEETEEQTRARVEQIIARKNVRLGGMTVAELEAWRQREANYQRKSRKEKTEEEKQIILEKGRAWWHVRQGLLTTEEKFEKREAKNAEAKRFRHGETWQEYSKRLLAWNASHKKKKVKGLQLVKTVGGSTVVEDPEDPDGQKAAQREAKKRSAENEFERQRREVLEDLAGRNYTFLFEFELFQNIWNRRQQSNETVQEHLDMVKEMLEVMKKRRDQESAEEYKRRREFLQVLMDVHNDKVRPGPAQQEEADDGNEEGRREERSCRQALARLLRTRLQIDESGYFQRKDARRLAKERAEAQAVPRSQQSEEERIRNEKIIAEHFKLAVRVRYVPCLNCHMNRRLGEADKLTGGQLQRFTDKCLEQYASMAKRLSDTSSEMKKKKVKESDKDKKERKERLDLLKKAVQRLDGAAKVHLTGASRLSGTRPQLYICKYCHGKLSVGTVPGITFWNKMEPDHLPVQFGEVNDLSETLIARQTPFMKIVALPSGGQRGLHGATNCVLNDWSSVERGLNLPRSAAETTIVGVGLRRKQEHVRDYLAQYVQPLQLWNLISWLVQHNPRYQDVQLNPLWKEQWFSQEPELSRGIFEKGASVASSQQGSQPPSTTPMEVGESAGASQGSSSSQDWLRRPTSNVTASQGSTASAASVVSSTASSTASTQSADVRDTVAEDGLVMDLAGMAAIHQPRGSVQEAQVVAAIGRQLGAIGEEEGTVDGAAAFQGAFEQDPKAATHHQEESRVRLTTDAVRQLRIASTRNTEVVLAPGEKNSPIPFLNNIYGDVESFPTLYPLGRHGIYEKREIPITAVQFTRNRIMHRDLRYSTHPTYLFWY